MKNLHKHYQIRKRTEHAIMTFFILDMHDIIIMIAWFIYKLILMHIKVLYIHYFPLHSLRKIQNVHWISSLAAKRWFHSCDNFCVWPSWISACMLCSYHLPYGFPDPQKIHNSFNILSQFIRFGGPHWVFSFLQKCSMFHIWHSSDSNSAQKIGLENIENATLYSKSRSSDV